ncbi:hypothetical protein HJG60_011350 [Phyllostomus discolor]|uniref:Uncharacterized protein n=1 Tax=Phyllostomus discolor TaxID=89673 RepID=A0A834E5E0_9CHIR|nr:hypothetical protein HJG60_011350 [Phyllostomus discolor]
MWTGEQGAHLSLGAAGLGEPRGRAVVEGKGLLLPCSCRPTSARSGLSWGGDAAVGLDTCHIYGPDTGQAFRTASSGCSLLELSGRTLETIYSPKAPGTSGSVPSVTLKSPWGLAILENIFD